MALFARAFISLAPCWRAHGNTPLAPASNINSNNGASNGAQQQTAA